MGDIVHRFKTITTKRYADGVKQLGWRSFAGKLWQRNYWDFESQVGQRKRTKTKAAEVEHAIRHHLEVDLDDDPDLRASFADTLKKILENFKNNWRKIYEELEKLRARISNQQKEPTYGLHRKKQMPLFRRFNREIFGEGDLNLPGGSRTLAELPMPYRMTEEDRISHLVDLTQKAFLVVERELKLTGFWESIPARNKLKAELQVVYPSGQRQDSPPSKPSRPGTRGHFCRSQDRR